jgi:ATP synthase F1 delta subunit
MNIKELDSAWRIVGDYLSFCPVFLAFIRQIAINRRFSILSRIKYVFNVAFIKYKNMRNVVVSSPVELLPEQKQRIEKLISLAFKEKIIIRYKINESLLAGIKISSEELVIDASAKVQLRQLLYFYKDLRLKGAVQ